MSWGALPCPVFTDTAQLRIFPETNLPRAGLIGQKLNESDPSTASDALCKGFAFSTCFGLRCSPNPAGGAMPDAQQFEAFMRKYQNMVYSSAMRLLTNPAEAEDVSQETFLRAFQHFDQLESSPTAGGWLKTVATNLSLNHLSRYRSRWSFFTDLFSSHAGEEPEEPDFASPENLQDELESADRHRVVERALSKLPPAQRVPLVLYHLEGLSYEEIASKLKISLGKVKTDIFRGREALRKRLRLQLVDVVG